MQKMTKMWDYLIVTAANAQQASAYDIQIRQRQDAGEIPQARTCMVIPDIDGKRIGSGGSTLYCLHQVLCRQRGGVGPDSFEEAESILSSLRILIVHAGGDSRRLPAYSHCGKMFVPIPAKGNQSAGSSLFDRLVPAFFSLPESPLGQVVVASGDALILFDPSAVELNRSGITALGSYASSNEGAHHGVFCAGEDGSVRRFLQKPPRDAQIAAGAVNNAGDVLLDVGVMSCDAGATVQLMRAFFEPASKQSKNSSLAWKSGARAALFTHGIDLYREICCALGTETTLDEYISSVRVAGSIVDTPLLAEWYRCLRPVSFNVEILPRCRFLHFGTTRQLITSGMALLAEDLGEPTPTSLVLNSDIQSEMATDHAWIDGCFVGGSLTFEGFNSMVGLDVTEPLRLRKGACLDMSAGVNRKDARVWFLRYYDIDDTFKHSAEEGGTFCGRPLKNWLKSIGAVADDLWPTDLPPAQRTLWNARVFPAVDEHQGFRQWLWLLDAESGTEEQKIAFLNADRYSSSEIALRVDQRQFLARRARLQRSMRLQATATPKPGFSSPALIGQGATRYGGR